MDCKTRLKRQGKIPASILEQEEDALEIEDLDEDDEDATSEDVLPVLDAAINSLDINAGKDSTWIIDSRAARHIIGPLSGLETERYVSSVVSAGGQSPPVEGTGNVCIHHSEGEIKISNILYALEVKKNIMSVRSFIKEGYKVIFDEPDCVLVDKKTNQVNP